MWGKSQFPAKAADANSLCRSLTLEGKRYQTLTIMQLLHWSAPFAWDTRSTKPSTWNDFYSRAGHRSEEWATTRLNVHYVEQNLGHLPIARCQSGTFQV